MFDKRDIDRITVLAGRAQKATITLEEKEELRRLLGAYSPRVWGLPWDDLLHVAYFLLGVCSLAEAAQAPVVADAS